LEVLDFGERRRERVPVLLTKSVAQESQGAQQELAVAGRLALTPFKAEAVTDGMKGCVRNPVWLWVVFHLKSYCGIHNLIYNSNVSYLTVKAPEVIESAAPNCYDINTVLLVINNVISKHRYHTGNLFTGSG